MENSLLLFHDKLYLDSMLFREGTVEHPRLFTKHVDSVYACQIAWTESGATPASASHASTCETEHRISSETGERGAPGGLWWVIERGNDAWREGGLR